MKSVVVIPARMGSTRFPGKPLANIMGFPMIEHIRQRELLAEGIDQVVVATCDQEIMDVVLKNGGSAVMTSDRHERSSERVAEAMESLSGDIVVVAQGDEPLLFPTELQQVAEPFMEDDTIQCVSLLSPLEGDDDYNNPNIVKAVCDLKGFLLFLSRAPIPYYMKEGNCPVYRETGIRAFRSDFLQEYVAFPETPFEKVEAVDMLRILEHGHKIFGVLTDYATIGVDHKEDVSIVEAILRENPAQQAIIRKIFKENS